MLLVINAASIGASQKESLKMTQLPRNMLTMKQNFKHNGFQIIKSLMNITTFIHKPKDFQSRHNILLYIENTFRWLPESAQAFGLFHVT